MPPQGAPGQPLGYYTYVPPKHPQATTVLVLGILSLVLCQILGPFAWKQGNKVQAEIQASGGAYSGDSEANIGKILGIIGTIFLIVMVAFFVIYILFIVIFFGVIMGTASTV